ncbi:bifunctional metallophosphatase/5'-nucleotidase [Lactococcus fujiensis]|uniref:bifunctional metallophosphatase/5'-nucleotidase n=1 Tax=Lactococcus fujiensis TaxID=610251 RepID=UPI000BDE9FF2|nr:bifunctional UDP-sugar hydrolase/5'-nucleotidase [Lactococcus fujiensis]
MNNLRILHLNDLHSHLENFPVIERFFAEQTAEFSSPKNVLRFDLGDNIDRVHPLTEATNGQMNVALMNRLNLTAATIGNNEGLGLTHEMLSHLYDEAEFPVLLSNLETNFAKGPMIFTTTFGLRVGIIGLTAPYRLAYPSAGWELSDPISVLDDLLPLDCDFTILLSHLGKNVDEKITERYDIDLIIGAHTHHLFEHGAISNGTLLAAAGKYGQYVGQIDLTFNEENHLVDHQIEAIATNTLPKYKSDALDIKGWQLQGHKLLSGTQLAQLEHPIPNQYPHDEASHFLGEILTEASQTDACILNSGLIVADEIPQNITLDTLHDLLPHSIRMVRFTITGFELREVLMEMIDVSAFLSTQQIRGMGFRGKTFGRLVLHQLKIEHGEFYIQKAGVWEKIIPNESYQIVVPDQYLFTWYFPILKKIGKSEIIFPYFLREIVAHKLIENEKGL